MITEMIEKMPTTQEALLKITYYTRSIYDKYSGEKFLEILQHYAKLIAEVREEEEKKNREKAAAKIRAEQEKEKKMKQMKTGTLAGIKNSKTYGLVDDNDGEGSEATGWLNSKRGRPTDYSQNVSKRSKTDTSESEYFQSSSTKKKKPSFFKKKSKFNNYKFKKRF
jgi:hypothetical protein